MSDQPDNMVVAWMRKLDAKIDRIGEDVREIKQRTTTVEHQIAQVVATEASHYASLSSRLDRLEQRIDRIERRLDLVEP